LLEGAALKSSRLRESDSTYNMPYGKSNPIRDHYRELTMNLENDTAPARKFQVVFRAYNDGVAYRYVLPKQRGVKSVEVTSEPGTFQFVGDPQMWPLYFNSYVNSHEGIYDPGPFSALATNQLIDVPLLAEFDNGVSVAFTEANLKNYAGLYVRAEDINGQKRMRCDLSPLPDKPGVKVISRLPLPSPWRAFLIGAEPGRLIESDLLLNLNDPNVTGNDSWLKAGKTSFYWWNGIQEPVDPHKAFEWEKNYIDFCASNDIEFHAVIGTEGDHPWYYQTTGHYSSPGPDADVTRPRPGFEMAKLVKYAHSKGVGIRVWVHWKPLSEHLEAAFTQYQKWGLSGVMVDFLDHNDQEMVNFANKVVQVAARHHLDVNFHGIWAPTGLERTYPNLFNHEGALNEEYLKWTDRCTPQHDVTMAFTRMLAGPMDYHLGGFRGAYRDQFKHRVVKPIVYGTRCFQLAMYVVFENPLPMVCDTPDSYIGQPGFDFLREVPTTWDETRVLSGQIGKYIVVARRKGSDWYVGAMTDWTPRELTVPLVFLAPGEYQVETWADVKGDPDANHLAFERRQMRAGDTLTMSLNSGGGEVIRIKPLKK
jgi:alpha-glucosidase